MNDFTNKVSDMADDATMLVDPLTGLVFEVREYSMYRQSRIEISVCWGVKAVKSDGIVVLMG